LKRNCGRSNETGKCARERKKSKYFTIMRDERTRRLESDKQWSFTRPGKDKVCLISFERLIKEQKEEKERRE